MQAILDAAATAMEREPPVSDLSRRAVVAGLPVVVLPAVAIAAPATSNLSRLLEMERQLARIATDREVGYRDNVASFKRWSKMLAAWSIPRRQGYSARASYEFESALTRWRRRIDQAEADVGLTATKAKLSDLSDERSNIIEQAWLVPATDLPSLQCKARMAGEGGNLLGSVAADVLAMVQL